VAGPLTQSPLSPGFWRGMAGGVRDQVVKPMASSVMAGHQGLKDAYPLPYEVAQLYPPVGIPAAGLDYIQGAQQGSSEEMTQAALSGIPVAGRAFKVGSAVPSLRQAATVTPAQHGLSLANPVMGATFKLGAAENVTQMGEAAYDQTRYMQGNRNAR
jgi:hypothetical protein